MNTTTTNASAGRIDPALIENARAADIRDVWRRLGLPEPNRDGKVKSPWRTEDHASVQVGGDKNIVHDYGGDGETLDAIALVRRVLSCSFAEAVSWLNNGHTTTPARTESKTKPKPILPVPDEAGAPKAEHYEYGRPSAIWRYQDAAGRLLGFAYRFDLAGGKQIVPQTYCQHEDGTRRWTWKQFDVPRPLYGLDRLAARPDSPVLWNEGEKSADAAGRLFPEYVCIASPGGAHVVDLTDYGPLKGRTIYIWPDADEPGRTAAPKVARLAKRTGALEVKIVPVPADFPEGWDLADAVPEGWDFEQLVALLANAECWRDPEPEADKTQKSASEGDDESDVRADLWQISQQKLNPTEKNRVIADAVVQWLHGRGRFYYHVERRDFASVLYFDSTDKTLLPVQSDAFQARLSDALAMNRSERTFAFVQSAIETEGLSGRATAIEPAAYWARTPDAIFISNGPGCMIRIRAGNVELVDNGTDDVLFPYGATLESWNLVDPHDPFEACTLFRGISTIAPHGRDLFKLYAISLPTDPPNKPPLVSSGPVGSGKTALARGLFALYGLPARIMAVLKGGESDFWTALDAGGLVTFDNADTSIEWLPDALASAATGGEQVKRRLYTDNDQVVLKARSWIVITSASPTFASDAGLADRLLVVRQDRRRGETAESTLFDEIRANRDAGLSWIAWTLARALADTAPVPKGLNARHPDFAAMAVRIGRAIGREQEAIAALRAAEADKAMFNLENDVAGAAVLDLVRLGSFQGTAAGLLDALKPLDASFEKMTTKRIAKRLEKLWPHLESALFASKEPGHGGIIRYSFSLRNGGFGGFQRPFSRKVPMRENENTLYETTPSNPPNPPNDAETELLDDPDEVARDDRDPF